MAVRIRCYLDIDQVGEGGGTVLGGGISQANNPGVGQAAGGGSVGNGQTMRIQTAEQVLGTSGSLTLAQIRTALGAAADDFAGSSGSPLITAAILAQINAWNTGGP